MSARKQAQMVLELREATGGDQVIVFPYASGMSAKRDMSAAVESLAGVGAEISRVSKLGMSQIAAAVAAGKPVFVDSGAFNAFRAAMRAGKPGEARLAFGPVLAKYRELSRQVCEAAENYHDRALLMLVAPDVVGDQVATLELIEEHREAIMELIEAGHEVIVPFQRGPVHQFNALLRVKAALEDLPFVVGIPSAEAAMNNADLLELLGQDYQPDRLHILGAISSRRMEERMQVIRDVYVDGVPGVTADANVMRSQLHQVAGKSGQEKFEVIKQILNRVVPSIWGGAREFAISM